VQIACKRFVFLVQQLTETYVSSELDFGVSVAIAWTTRSSSYKGKCRPNRGQHPLNIHQDLSNTQQFNNHRDLFNSSIATKIRSFATKICSTADEIHSTFVPDPPKSFQ